MAPIKGLRYKCSVCKNFDYCAGCEERLGHEHAFLKIRKEGGAPDVMITMLDENEESEENNKPAQHDPMQFIAQLMKGLGGGRRGHGPSAARCGRGRFGERSGPRGPPYHHMMEQLQAKFGEWGEWAKKSPEQLEKKMKCFGPQWRNF